METQINEVLRECRLRAGLKQSELAERLSIDQAVISNVERGKTPPSYTLVKQWARATRSTDIIGMDLGGNDGWKKFRKLEEAVKHARTLLDVSFMRIRRR
ncbi:helix-turn-helix transcriptional regulator [Gorillibacterium sp. sgz5001074]|uniref:helix-turn-helix transcriptional regulator n=1 Tax=Gorillibacterium sp. sgz5001074 TaxID=3446695 RepID=UPI003F669171